MALSVDCPTTVIGIPMSDTYARIVHFQGDKTNCHIFVEHYASEDARHGNAQYVSSHSFTAPTPQVTGGLPAMYTWLKQQPMYATAEDC